MTYVNVEFSVFYEKLHGKITEKCGMIVYNQKRDGQFFTFCLWLW